ncbi:hypothetical protein CLOLEP_03901 [[Clostridium] leptum DSM 753]|uniref:Uncharacterized protein n=1 Tax=[Clostridium] leptum DSM 753 TaxID=428125 RepID=A7VZ72_9FIRM|nr:hypothetical protein CLOLEP_03901 [[Clostridium] leptum DSM 753]
MTSKKQAVKAGWKKELAGKDGQRDNKERRRFHVSTVLS